MYEDSAGEVKADLDDNITLIEVLHCSCQIRTHLFWGLFCRSSEGSVFALLRVRSFNFKLSFHRV